MVLSAAGILLRNIRLLLLDGRVSSGRMMGGSGPGYDIEEEEEGDGEILWGVI